MKAAFYGKEGSFTHQVVSLHFPNTEHVQFPSFDEGIGAVREGKCDLALFPIENSNSKSIVSMQRALLNHVSGVLITDLIPHHIQLNCYSFGELNQITEIRSKNVVFAQARKWISENCPEAELRDDKYDTATAVHSLTEDEAPHLAAIGSFDAEKLYKVPVLARNIQTEPNITVFARIECKGQKIPDFTTTEKILIAFEDFNENHTSKLNEIAVHNACMITYNWVLPASDEVGEIGVFEVGTPWGFVQPGALKNIAGEVIRNMEGAKLVGGYEGKTMESLLTSKHRDVNN